MSPPPAARRDNTHPSCSVCQRRKVKCDRVYPCAACTKSRLDCVFPPSPPPQSGGRKRRRITAEETPQSSGASLDKQNTDDRDSPGARPSARSAIPPSQPSHLIYQSGGLRDNYLWRALGTETTGDNSTDGIMNDRVPEQESKDITTGKHKRSFIFGSNDVEQTSLHLPPNHIITLWQAYISNVDPVTKIIHVPTVQQLVLGQIGQPAVPMNQRCLIAAIYLIATVSLTERECRATLQAGRDGLIRSLKLATEQALSAAGFVTTADIVVLQALVLYLSTLRSLGETQAVWTLGAMANRIGRTIGLSRDGSTLSLPPFESEMRRRLWWQLVYLDSRTAELVGSDGDLLASRFDVQQPSNLGDNDLFPSMKKLPEPRPEATEMMYVRWRAAVGLYLRSTPGIAGDVGTWSAMRLDELSLSERKAVLDKVETRMKEEFIQYCDPVIPLQYLTVNAGQIFMNKMRLIAQRPNNDIYSQDTFSLSLETMELQLSIWFEPSQRRWRWYWQGHFQWYALACLIRQARLLPSGSEAQRAWTTIRKVFDVIIPTMELVAKKSLMFDAIRSLLNSAACTQNGGNTEEPAVVTEPATTEEVGADVPGPETAPRTGVFSFYGSRPHNALLPGMSSSTWENRNGVSSGEVVAEDRTDPVSDFDFDAIDWAEFDRLAAELYEQDILPHADSLPML